MCAERQQASRRAFFFRLTLTAPNCLFNAEAVIGKTQHAASAGEAGYVPSFLDVFFANRPAAELADRAGFLFTGNAFHRQAP
jgi:hypothetical protein